MQTLVSGLETSTNAKIEAVEAKMQTQNAKMNANMTELRDKMDRILSFLEK